MDRLRIFLLISTVIPLISCGPLLNDGEEREKKFLLDKLKDGVTFGPVEEGKQVDGEPQQLLEVEAPELERIDEHEKSSEVVHFNSKGESIEKEKEKLPVGVACKAPKDAVPPKATHSEKPPKVAEEKENKEEHKKEHHASSSVEEHAIRFDKHGNTQEEYKDSEEEHHEHQMLDSEPPKRRKKKKTKRMPEESDEEENRINVNHALNEDVVNKGLQIRDLANESSGDDDDEEDDIPLITIPMVDILKKYQRMAHGFESSTEEYSDELQQQKQPATNHFDDPHLKNVLQEISAERKRVRQERKEGKKVKPAAMRIFEDLSKSEEEL